MTTIVCRNCGYKNHIGIYTSSGSYSCQKCGISLDLQNRAMPMQSIPIQKEKTHKIKYFLYFIFGIVVIIIVIYVINLILPLIQTITNLFK